MSRLSAVVLAAFAALILVTAAACTAASGPLNDVGNSLSGDPSAAGPDEQPDDGSDEEPNQQPADAALVVHTGSLDLEVADLRSAVDQATALIAGMGGNVAESHERNTEHEHSASVTFRIPAARWSEAITGLRGLAQRVIAEDTDAEDVTAQVVDLDARIANLRTSEAALQGIMERATTIADVLKVQGELTKVRGDIESMTAQRDHLANQAAMGTLEVGFNVPIAEASAASQGWNLGEEIDGAVAALVRVGQGLASLAIWLGIVVLPVVLPVALIGYVALRLRRRHLAREAVRNPHAPSV